MCNAGEAGKRGRRVRGTGGLFEVCSGEGQEVGEGDKNRWRGEPEVG